MTSTAHSTPLASIPFNSTDGTCQSLADYTGQVVLVVNVASKCGLAPQYEGLQRLFERYQDQGFSVIGFPANDFMGQEPGTDAEIAEICQVTYAVTFPVMSKISVVGANQHPLYAELARQAPTAEGNERYRESLRDNGFTPTEDPDVLWNFEKFLIARDGTVVGRFAPGVTPDDPALQVAVAAPSADRAQ